MQLGQHRKITPLSMRIFVQEANIIPFDNLEKKLYFETKTSFKKDQSFPTFLGKVQKKLLFCRMKDRDIVLLHF